MVPSDGQQAPRKLSDLPVWMSGRAHLGEGGVDFYVQGLKPFLTYDIESGELMLPFRSISRQPADGLFELLFFVGCCPAPHAARLSAC